MENKLPPTSNGVLRGQVTAKLQSSHLGLRHHVLIRLQVDRERLPHFSDAVIQNLHLHKVLRVALLEDDFLGGNKDI